MDWKHALFPTLTVPYAMVTSGQADEIGEAVERRGKSIMVQLLLPLLPGALALAVLFGGMRWALGNVESKLEAVEARQIDILTRLVSIETTLELHLVEEAKLHQALDEKLDKQK